MIQAAPTKTQRYRLFAMFRFASKADIQPCLGPAVFFEMFDETQLNSPLA